MEQYRVVDTPHGALTYLLVKKRVKNLNLRLNRQGQAILSVPLRCPEEQADGFIREKSGWIVRNQPALPTQPLPAAVDRETCKQLLGEAVLRVYPLVSGAGVALPQVRVRKMKSQWGNCHYRQGYITLNSALARCPQELRDYVALHAPPRPRPGLLRCYGSADARLETAAQGPTGLCVPFGRVNSLAIKIY